VPKCRESKLRADYASLAPSRQFMESEVRRRDFASCAVPRAAST